MKKSISTAFVLALLTGSVCAGTVLPNKQVPHKNQTFMEALSSAYQNNPDVHAGLREYYASVEALPLAKAGWLPTLILTGTGQHKKTLSNGKNVGVGGANNRVRSNRSDDTLTLDTTLKQNIFNGGQTTYDVKRAKATVQSAQMKFVGVEQKVLLDAVKAYLDLWKAHETLEYRTASVGFRERVVAQVKAQEDVGEKTRTDVSEARSRLARAIADRLSAEAALSSAQAVYQQVIAVEQVPDHLHMPGLLVSKKALPETLKELSDLALVQSPSLQQAVFAEKAQKAAIGIAEGELLPNVDLSASAARTKSNTQNRASVHEGPTSSQKGFGYSNTGTVAMTVTVPLFQPKSWSGLRKANQQRYQALSNVKKARLEVAQAVTGTWQGVKSLEAVVRQVELQVSSAKLNLEGKRQEYLVGERTLTDTLDAEQNLVDAQVQLVAKQRDYQVNFYQLMSLYGALLPGQLGLGIGRHDVTGYSDSMSFKVIGTGDLRRPLESE